MGTAMTKSAEILHKEPLFCMPQHLPASCISYLLRLPEYATLTSKQLSGRVSSCPVLLPDLLGLFDRLAGRFSRLMKSKWLRPILQHVEQVAAKHPRRPKRSVARPDDIDASLMRYFTLLNTYLARQLIEKMEQSMVQYVQFLGQFLLRRPELLLRSWSPLSEEHLANSESEVESIEKKHSGQGSDDGQPE